MISWLKNLFGSKNKPIGCCGGGCCGHKNQQLLPIEEHEASTVRELDAKIVIGKIHEIFDHPDPKVTKVRVTNTEIAPGEIVQILCGAKNIEVGQVVPVATIGTDFGEGFVISQRAIRGVDSHGMICAKDELGLEKIDDGIWVLPVHLEQHLGRSLSDF